MLNEIRERIKKYVNFEINEFLLIILLGLIIGFIIGVDDGRANASIDIFWYKHFFSSFIAAFIAIFVNIITLKTYGIYLGYKITYKFNSIGNLIALIISFLSYGKIMFFVPGGFESKIIPHLRFGKFRFGPNLFDEAKIGLLSLISNIVIASLLKSFFPQTILVKNIIIANILYAIYGILPLPKTNIGLNILSFSPKFYLFSLYFVVITALLVFLVSPLFCFLLGALLGFIAYLNTYKKL